MSLAWTGEIAKATDLDLADSHGQLAVMIDTVKELSVPSTDLSDDDYGMENILSDLERLYNRSRLLKEMDNLLAALRTEVGYHTEEVSDRIKILNRMLAQHLGAA